MDRDSFFLSSSYTQILIKIYERVKKNESEMVTGKEFSGTL